MSALEANIAKANKYLARFREQGVLNQIGGEAKPSCDGTTFETISPMDLRPLANVAHGKAADIDRAAKAAKRAFPAWAALSGDKRKALLHKIADAIVARAEEIAFAECMDTGQALKFMAKAALRGAENFHFFADRAPEARDGRVLRTAGQLNITARAPIGPVGIITPWNTPFMLSTWKIAPALAAGCTVVHKPAEFSPLTARLLVEIAEAAGLPPGVWNVVNGMGEDAGKALTEHPDIRAIGFVGESSTGSLIMKQGADTLKRVHFELGGKNPGHRVRRRGSRARCRRRHLHDLLAQRRALHIVIAASRRGADLRKVHRGHCREGKAHQDRAPARSRHRDRSAHPPHPRKESAGISHHRRARRRDHRDRRRQSRGSRRRLLCRPYAFHRREQSHADCAGRNFRAGADGHFVQGRGGSVGARQ